ncbi:MAG TPA: hypothetical protein VGQ93_02915 [Lysobacter sp.]|jgi:hypothetical protein|nr:hypothetical protein [Lysobacter sp.]
MNHVKRHRIVRSWWAVSTANDGQAIAAIQSAENESWPPLLRAVMDNAWCCHFLQAGRTNAIMFARGL